jgi:hypothetical protein
LISAPRADNPAAIRHPRKIFRIAFRLTKKEPDDKQMPSGF